METSLQVAVVTVTAHVPVPVTAHVPAPVPVPVPVTAPVTVPVPVTVTVTVDTFAIVVNCLDSIQLFQLIQHLSCRHCSDYDSGSGSEVTALASVAAVMAAVVVAVVVAAVVAVVVLDYDAMVYVMDPTVRDYLVR